MARLVGVDLPRDKRMEIALTYIYGIGRTRSQEILAATGIDRDLRTKDLTDDQVTQLRDYIEGNLKVEGDLQPRAGFDLIVRNLLRRVSMLTALYGQSELALDYPAIIARAAEIQTVESQLRWWDVPRYSNRQHTKLKMGGFVGSALYQGAALAEFLLLPEAGWMPPADAGVVLACPARPARGLTQARRP